MLSQLKRRTLFKVVSAQKIGDVELTPDGVYRVSVKRADRGQNIKISDMRTMRMVGTQLWLSGPVSVPTKAAKTIKVYEIST